ncbi:MAG: hypothetical protein IKP77_02620 [Acholeplasmatales bacterium]|nr:hypothetical protein [Acholeplasmatales bacterium]
MFGLGLSLTIIIYVLLICAIALYFVMVIKKKYRICDMLEKIVFFHSLFALMVESWALILMNDGFSVNFNIKVSLSFYYTIAILVPLISILVYSNIIYKRSYKLELDNKIDKVANYMILPFTIFALGASTIILFFNINYYVYYTM